MSLRSNGSYIGPRPTGPTNGLSGVASGIWDLRTAQRQRAAGAWPVAPPLSFFNDMQLWLDASDASSVTTVSGNVSQWDDKSGNGNHVSQSTAGNRPAYQTAVVNGLNAINFGGPATAHRLFRSSFTVSQPSVFTVFTIDSSYNGTDTLIVWDTGSGDRCVHPVESGTILTFRRTDDLATQKADISSALTKNKTYVSACVSDATGHQLWLNGVKGNDATAGTAGFNGLSVGNLRGNPTPVASPFVHYGRICEMIVYSTKKTDEQRASIENYLIAKWAIT